MSDNHDPEPQPPDAGPGGLPGDLGDLSSLEGQLRALEPAALNVAAELRLERACQRALLTKRHNTSQRQIYRAVLLASLFLCVIGGFHFYPGGDLTADKVPLSRDSQKLVDTLAPASRDTVERFAPVSSQGYVLRASSGGFIETEEGPAERVRVEYGNAYHWHDSATGTNLRVFTPSNEEFVVPLSAD
jgi:hypothetical protein